MNDIPEKENLDDIETLQDITKALSYEEIRKIREASLKGKIQKTYKSTQILRKDDILKIQQAKKKKEEKSE